MDGRTSSRGDALMMRSQNATVTTGTRIRKPRSVTAFMFERLRSPQWAAIPLRLIVGYGFMEHCYAKLIKGPAAFVSILDALGVPYAHAMAWLTILIELLGGFAVFVGAPACRSSACLSLVFSWLQCSPCICPMASVLSSSSL